MTPAEQIADLRRFADELRSIGGALSEPFDAIRAADGDDVWRGARATAFREQLGELERRTTGGDPTAVAGGIEGAVHYCLLRADALERDLALTPAVPGP